MNSTPLARLLEGLNPDAVLYCISIGNPQESATVYAVRQGVLYQHRATASGHGSMIPQVSDCAAWKRQAQVCAFTVPANPTTMHLGAAGERLGAFWRGLPSAAAEPVVSVPQLLHVSLVPRL